MSSPSKTSYSNSANPKPNSETIDFIERVRVNQEKLAKELKPHYDFIVCGSGSSGSVVARRLAENREVSVLLLEASGRDDVPSVIEANLWPLNSRVSGTGLSRAVTTSTSTGRSMPLPIVIIGERLERSGRWLTE
jgi:choline dehydrogenase